MQALLRLWGAAAIAGGVLRIADSFTAEALSPQLLGFLYFATDLFLLAGAAGLYWQRRAQLGWAGIAGLAMFALGILTVRLAAFGVLGPDGYRIGSAIALLGLAAYAIETLRRRKAAPWGPVLWLASLACGIAGAAGFAPGAMLIAAGVTFGGGFVAAGLENLTSA